EKKSHRSRATRQSCPTTPLLGTRRGNPSRHLAEPDRSGDPTAGSPSAAPATCVRLSRFTVVAIGVANGRSMVRGAPMRGSESGLRRKNFYAARLLLTGQRIWLYPLRRNGFRTPSKDYSVVGAVRLLWSARRLFMRIGGG